MDLEAMTVDGSGWTEERHASFLNRIEGAFVRRMLADDSEFSSSATASGRVLRRPPPPPPLDRRLPDSASESTHDFQIRWTNKSEPDSGDLVVIASRDRTTRRPPLVQYDVSQDQVVPQIGSTWNEGDYSNKKMKSRK